MSFWVEVFGIAFQPFFESIKFDLFVVSQDFWVLKLFFVFSVLWWVVSVRYFRLKFSYSVKIVWKYRLLFPLFACKETNWKNHGFELVLRKILWDAS